MTTYNAETWARAWERGEVRAGDYVTGDVVNGMMEALPPVCCSTECAQLGEPYSHGTNKYGHWRPLFLTWRLAARSQSTHGDGAPGYAWDETAIWEFCGACFVRETDNEIAAFEPTQVELIDETEAGLTKAEARLIRRDARQKAIYWSDERNCYWMYDFKSAGYWCAGLFFGNGLEELEGVDQFEPLRIRVTD